MNPPLRPYRTARCDVCGNLIPASNLPEHLLADARILRIIKATHPEWGRRECEEYLQSLASEKPRPAPYTYQGE